MLETDAQVPVVSGSTHENSGGTFDSIYGPPIKQLFAVDSLDRADVYDALGCSYRDFISRYVCSYAKISDPDRLTEMVESTLARLQTFHVIERFFEHVQKDQVVEAKDVPRILGMRSRTWYMTIRTLFHPDPGKFGARPMPPWLPTPIAGGDKYGSKYAKFYRLDILRLDTDGWFKSRKKLKSRKGCNLSTFEQDRSLLTPVVERDQLESFIAAQLRGFLDTLEIEPPVEAPSVLNSEQFSPHHRAAIQEIFEVDTIDKTIVYAQFAKLYGALVTHLVQRYNKVSANGRTREIVQEIHMQFKSARLIERFLEQSHQTMPETATAELACRALGISWEEFQAFVKGHVATSDPPDYMLIPVSGKPISKRAIYKTTAIMRFSVFLEESGYNVGQLDTACLVPQATKKHFQNYVSKSVNNRFKNFCRTEERHNKERVWDTFAELRPVDDNTSWEHRLADKTSASQEARAELSLITRKIMESPAAALCRTIFDLVTKGHDLEEAISRLDLSPNDKRKTRRLLDPWLRVIQEKRAARPSKPRLPVDDESSTVEATDG